MSIDIYTQLLKIIEQQQTTIEILVNENAELENALKVMCEEIDLGHKRIIIHIKLDIQLQHIF